MNEQSETAIVVRDNNLAVAKPLTVTEIIAQVNLIQEVMAKVMQEGEHFGKIPGCGDKPTLLKAGAEKLKLTFRFAARYSGDDNPRDMGNGHREYIIRAELFTIGGNVFVGAGVGSCSTLEAKYRYRTGPRTPTEVPVPKAYWDLRQSDPRKAQEMIGGKGFSTMKDDAGQWVICEQGEKVEHDNPADYYNCVTPDTKVLTHDLQWIPAGEIESGDMLIGVEEDISSQYARHLAIGEATVNGRKTEPLYEVTFADGRVVRCNGEHKWLVKKIGLKGTEWVATQDIRNEIDKDAGRPRKWTVMSVCTPWVEDTSKESGYIAGLLDADGSLGAVQLSVMFAQQLNTVMARLQSALVDRGYQLAMNPCITQESLEQTRSQKQVYSVRVLGGFTEQIRLLGSIRPPRLLERWLTLIDLAKRRLEGRGSGAGRPVCIVSVEPIGEGEVVMLGTSCHTYLAEGLVCHNTVLKIAKKRADVDAVLSSTAASDIFTQDLDDMADNETPTKAKVESKPPQRTTAQPRKPQPAKTVDVAPPDDSNPELMPQKDEPELKEGELRMYGKLECVVKKPGKKKDGSPFTRYGFKFVVGEGDTEEEVWSNSFDRTLGELGDKMTGKMVYASYIEEQYQGNTVKNITGLHL